jgi:hypothetical protein
LLGAVIVDGHWYATNWTDSEFHHSHPEAIQVIILLLVNAPMTQLHYTIQLLRDCKNRRRSLLYFVLFDLKVDYMHGEGMLLIIIMREQMMVIAVCL